MNLERERKRNKKNSVIQRMCKRTGQIRSHAYDSSLYGLLCFFFFYFFDFSLALLSPFLQVNHTQVKTVWSVHSFIVAIKKSGDASHSIYCQAYLHRHFDAPHQIFVMTTAFIFISFDIFHAIDVYTSNGGGNGTYIEKNAIFSLKFHFDFLLLLQLIENLNRTQTF